MKSSFYPGLIFLLITAWLAAACSSTPTRTAPASVTQTATARPPTASALLTNTPTPLPTSRLPPTYTPHPKASPSALATEILLPQREIEPVAIPPCEEDGTGDGQIFYELFQTLTQAIYEMDSYQYDTLYRYAQGEHYADEELSVEVEGAHDGLLTTPPETYFYPFGSQAYERSQVTLTDSKSGSTTETIVTDDGFWVRESGDPGWVAFDPATPSDLSNLAEMFSPQVVAFLIGGGGSLAPGSRGEEPAMRHTETLDGREVVHRCWLPPAMEGSDINTYLIHRESLYTFLSDAQVHLWTTKDDKQLVRLAVTGKHKEERLGEEEFAEHDTPRDFLLLMDITDVGEPQDIQPPNAEQIALTIPAADKPATGITAPYNDLPLPENAAKAGVFGDETEPSIPTPREYLWANNSNAYVIDDLYKSGWYEIHADRRPTYAAEMSLSKAATFYLDEMGRRGWQLKDKFYQLGWPSLNLFFERDGVIMPVILETKQAGTTHISAILPPSDEALQAVLSGWTTYTPDNSGLSGEVNAITFDPQGKAWIGTSSGVDVFDDKTWITYPEEELGLPEGCCGFDAYDLDFDGQGQVWVGTSAGLAVYDGQNWNSYIPKNSKLPDSPINALATDKSGRVWLSFARVSGLSVFDGKTFTKHAPGENGLPGSGVEVIAHDQQGRIWIGTSGGVYRFDGEAWVEVLKAKSPPNTIDLNNTIEDLAIDQQGRVWIGTGEGLSVFDGKDWITYTPENSGMPFQGIDALAIDEYDQIWIAGGHGAVGVLETDGTWQDYTPLKDAAGGYSTNELAIDPQGHIWVGTDEGINVFTPPQPSSTGSRVLPDPTPILPQSAPLPTPGPGWTSYTSENTDLDTGEVFEVAVDGQDRIWMATTRGISVFRPNGEWTSYTIDNSGLLDTWFFSLAIDALDQVWAGSQSAGLTVLGTDGGWKTYTPSNSGLSNETVDKLVVDSQGRVWAANNCHGSACQALDVLAPDGTWTTEKSDLASRVIFDMAADNQKQVWVATGDGVSVLAPNGQRTDYSLADLGLTGEYVYVNALAVDGQGRAWFGSGGGGLVMLAPDGNLTAYTVANSGLASDDITALLVDEAGRVWVGTDEGLSVLSPDGQWESYTYEDSEILKGYIYGLAMDSKGRLWIASDAGLGVFVPGAP